MTRRHPMAMLMVALASFCLVLWPSQGQAQLLSHQKKKIPSELQPVYDGVKKQMTAKVANANTRFRNGEIGKSEYQAKLKEITEWRAKTLLKVEYKEHLKGVEVGREVLKDFDTTRSKLKGMRDSGKITPQEYSRKFFEAEKNLRVKSRNIDAKYSERMHTLFNKATGSGESLGSGMYVTKNNKIVLDPVTKMPIQNEKFRAQTAGGDIDKAASKTSTKKAIKLAKELGIKVKIDHGSVDFEDISVTINRTSKEFEAKKALKSIAISKRGVETRLKQVTSTSQRKVLRAELADLRTREVAAKKLLKKSKLKSFDNKSLANKETYNHVRGKEWAKSAPKGTSNLTKAVVDSIETNDHMNKAAKALGKPTKKMTNEDVQNIAKSVMKTLGPSASGQKGSSLNDAELGRILKGTQWEGKPQEFRKTISDLKPTKHAKDFFHKDIKGLDDLKRVARDVGKQTQTKRLNKVAAEMRAVESRIGKTEGFLENGTGKGRKAELLKKSLREVKATVRTAKNLTRESLAGSIANQKAAGIKATNVTGNHPELRPNYNQVREIEGLIKGPSRGARGLKSPSRLERFKSITSKVGRGTFGALEKGVGVFGKIEMGRQLYEKTKERTYASDFKGEVGSYGDYKDRANIIGGAAYEVARELTMVNQLNRDRETYTKQNLEYYKTQKVSSTMKNIYAANAGLKAGGWFLFNNSPVGMGYYLTDGASNGLGNYIYNKGDDARRRAAQSQFSDTALRRKQAGERLRSSVVYQGQFEMMQLQREQDAMANGGYPKDSSQARAIAKFLTTVDEPKSLYGRYGETRKLQRMITGEMDDLRKSMYSRREDGGLYDPTYYEGIQRRIGRLDRAIKVARKMAVTIHQQERGKTDVEKLGTKNSFELFKSESEAFKHELGNMRYRMKGTLYDATQQKDREATQEKERDLAVSQTFVDGSIQNIGNFFAGLGTIFGGEGVPADQTPQAANNPLAGVNQLKDALLGSTRDALGSELNGDGIRIDVPTPQEVTQERQNAANENTAKSVAFENTARDLAAKEDMAYKEVVKKIELKERAKERDRQAQQRKLRKLRDAREKRQAEIDKKYDGSTLEDLIFRKWTPEEVAAQEAKTKAFREKRWKDRERADKARDARIVAALRKARKVREKAPEIDLNGCTDGYCPVGDFLGDPDNPSPEELKSQGLDDRTYTDSCGGGLCDTLPPELEDFEEVDCSLYMEGGRLYKEGNRLPPSCVW
jgi:hypothetical protein